MVHYQPDTQFEEIVELLEHPRIANCESRQGLRRLTGNLLEDAFLTLVTRIGPDLSVEVGAHEADFSVRLKNCLPRVHCLAFEANPYVFAKFTRFGRRRLKSIVYKNVAICGKTGSVDIHVPRRWRKGSFARANAISSLLPRIAQDFEFETVNVPALTLDDAVDGLKFANAVAWIDVEGAQQEVLRSASGFLSRTAAIYIEVETAGVWRGQLMSDEVSALLASYGFVPVMRDNLAKVQFNIIYVANSSDKLALAHEVAADFKNKITAQIS